MVSAKISSLLFSFLSEIPYDLFNSGTLQAARQNVFFTLLLGFLWILAPLMLATLLACFIAPAVMGGFNREDVMNYIAQRENEHRLELEQINTRFGGKSLLTVTDVSRYTGRSREWVRKRYGISGKKGMTAVELAQAISAR